MKKNKAKGAEFMRKRYVDYMKAIGIILVILGHINFANEIIKNWIYAFHMPLFFFATGLTIRKATINRKLVLKKIKSLMVPYFIWGLIYSGYTVGNLVRLGYGSYNAICSSGSLTSLWFLPAMFLSVILVQILFSITLHPLKLATVTMVILVISVVIPSIEKGYPWCIDVSLLATVFIICGYLFENYLGKMIQNGGYKSYIFVGIIGGVMTFAYRFNPINYESYILMANRKIGNPAVFLITAVGGCIMFYGVSKIIENIVKLKPDILSFIGINTLTILVVHKPIISIFERVFMEVTIPKIVELVSTCLGVLVISCILCFLINYLSPCLVGKNISNENRR